MGGKKPTNHVSSRELTGPTVARKMPPTMILAPEAKMGSSPWAVSSTQPVLYSRALSQERKKQNKTTKPPKQTKIPKHRKVMGLKDFFLFKRYKYPKRILGLNC